MNLTHLLDIQESCNYSLLAQGSGHRYLSKANGIRPIMVKINEDSLYFKEHVVVDRIIGKAAAMMLIRSQVAYIHGRIMSESAHAILDKHHIAHSYDQLVGRIENRDQSGMCPMEETVQTIDDMEIAYAALKATITRLMNK